mmetsp:Transcript_907/g.2371  ORF Transcript_907/g.2371 Transcript_907/m.2371 type:complete len:135 (-) Transcript_907:624-1028(-)
MLEASSVTSSISISYPICFRENNIKELHLTRESAHIALQPLLSLLLLLVQTFHETLCKLLSVETLSDEDKFIDSFFAILPGFLGRTKIYLLVNTLEDELCVSLSMESQQSLRTIDIRSTLSEKIHHEKVEPLSM